MSEQMNVRKVSTILTDVTNNDGILFGHCKHFQTLGF